MVTGGNNLQEYELVIKGLDNKPNKSRNNFTEWNKSVAYYTKIIGMNELFTYGLSKNTAYLILSQIKVFSDYIHKGTSAAAVVIKYKNECWYKFSFN